MVETHPLILSLRSAGLKDLDPSNVDEVHNMWHAFSKAKHSIDGGDRLEYLSWRLYSREILRQHASPRPKCATVTDSDVNTDEESQVSESSDDDWVSDNDDCASSNRADSVRSEMEAPRFIPESRIKTAGNIGRVRPGTVLRKQQRAFLDPRSNLHRPISSIELQHLFNDVQQKKIPVKNTKSMPPRPDPEGKKSAHASQKTDLTAPYSTSQNSSTTIDQPDIHREPSSLAVRGFSPSSISVTKFQNPRWQKSHAVDNSHGIASAETRSDANDNEVENPQAKKALPQKMFYFGEIDSDVDSSAAGSLDKLEKTENNDDTQGVRVDNNSDWDDTSDEEDETEENEINEARRREMFKERPVPTKPLLKRSLLSSLFVSQIKPRVETDDTARGSSDTKSNSAEQKDGEEVAAPVDILLGAPLAHHFPFIGPNTRTTSIGGGPGPSASNSRIIEIRNGRRPTFSRAPDSADNALIAPTDHLSPRIDDNSTDGGTHMTARPEIYRASTATGDIRNSGGEERFQQNWASQHEDIYDPLNYHSRGW